MSTTQFTVYMEPGKRRDVQVSVHPDGSAHAYCSAYADQAPILSVSHADISVTVTSPERSAVGEADLSFARDLAEAANTYLAEITRLHAEQSALSGRAGAAA
jgi:hypothetical protein